MARALSPADRLSLLVVAVFVAVLLAGDPHPWGVTALLLGFAAFVVVLAGWGARSRVGDVVHALLTPYASVALLFELSARLVAAVGARGWDAALAAADERFFPRLATAWHDLLGRPTWLTDFAGVAYVSFYLFPLAVGLAIFLRRPRRAFDDFAFATEAAFFVPYAGYVTMPAIGPRAEAELHGAAVAQAAHAFVQTVELNAHDAFPSGHAAAAIVVAALGARAFPKWSPLILATAASILFSTVYLSYHYVVDIVAGAAVAAAMPLLVPALRWICGARREHDARPLIEAHQST
jgi:membrane-associated phospholipid phosphatase